MEKNDFLDKNIVEAINLSSDICFQEFNISSSFKEKWTLNKGSDIKTQLFVHSWFVEHLDEIFNFFIRLVWNCISEKNIYFYFYLCQIFFSKLSQWSKNEIKELPCLQFTFKSVLEKNAVLEPLFMSTIYTFNQHILTTLLKLCYSDQNQSQWFECISDFYKLFHVLTQKYKENLQLGNLKKVFGQK